MSFAKPDAAMGLAQRINFVDLTTLFVSWVPEFVELDMICVICQARCWGGAPRRSLQCACCACVCVYVCMCMCARACVFVCVGSDLLS